MIFCPNCHHEEFPGALFCSKCGTQLEQNEENSTTNSIRATVIESFNEASAPLFPSPPADAADSILALHILSTGDVIHLHGSNELTIGRSTKGQTIIPDIDLSPYQAYEAGVSRLHANIIITGSQVTIQDLASANGTCLNGKRIDPHIEYSLTHGNILTFGRFKVQVLIRE